MYVYEYISPARPQNTSQVSCLLSIARVQAITMCSLNYYNGAPTGVPISMPAHSICNRVTKRMPYASDHTIPVLTI